MSESENKSPAPRGPLDEGDRVEYSLSVDGGGFWVKLGVNVRVRMDENALQAANRAELFVDNLLKMHVSDLQKQLRP